MIKHTLTTVFALGLSWIATISHAEQVVRADDVIVHYSAVRTTMLTPEIATRFGVTRSRNQALLVLNAQRDTGEGLPTPIPATATGHVTSLLGHRQVLKLMPKREGDVHYVLARFETLNGEFLTLDLQVTPEGQNKAIPVRWQQQFYND
jgi:hypothetical protein